MCLCRSLPPSFIDLSRVFGIVTDQDKTGSSTLCRSGHRSLYYHGSTHLTQAVERVHAKVQQAMDLGATLHLGGKILSNLGTHFYEPTILSDVPPEADLWKTETFGPVIAIRTFDTDDEALALAHDQESAVGLAAYFCTQNLHRAFRMAERLEYGIVGVNEGIISTCTAPFGGMKESGLGREGSSLGLAEYLETKYIFMNY